jgi:succinate-semialdehyde dehydrogenase/glutarate-semialdehyde dehydrogenase
MQVNKMNDYNLALTYLKALMASKNVQNQLDNFGFVGQEFTINNPFNDTLIGQMPIMSEKQISERIKTAASAQVSWRSFTAEKRAACLTKWHEEVKANQDNLAALLTLEQGKPLAEARTEVAASMANILWAAERALDSYQTQSDSHLPDATNSIYYEPVGVVGAITPWNFPSAMVTRKVAPALAAGCGVLLKPAEDTPYSALALVDLAYKAGLPEGLLQIVTLDRDNAHLFSEVVFKDKAVAMVSFTGSTAIGQKLIAASAENVTKLSLELGGNAPFIVCADADIDLAVEGAYASKFRNAGQTCICTNRFYIHESVYDAFKDKLIKRIERACVGDGFDLSVEIGPVINQRAFKRLKQAAQDLSEGGAELLLGKNNHMENRAQLFLPMVFECEHDLQGPRHEIFGPIACLFKFTDNEQALRLANDTDYGLAAYLYTNDAQAAQDMACQLQYGMVGINETRIADASIPFGGMKHSGIGREGGMDSLKNFMNLKYMCKKNFT